MSKAFEAFVDKITMENVSTTTMKAYTFVRLCTTVNKVDLITTRAYPAYGITQEAINPSDTGAIAVSGHSRLRMCGTAFTTMYVTTPMQIGPNASGNGCVLTTSVTLNVSAIGLSTFAASDIVTVEIAKWRAQYRL